MEDRFRKWVDVGNVLAIDPTEKVNCPECNAGLLLVEDVPIPESDAWDRYLICEHCKKWAVMSRMRKTDNP
ncbi:hypothetical protein ACE38W_13915 [Chitinophaga sp. Hz27]|uniref:hypothetical protein n=1 Tax=Chitinophaga sp. Hz27 TaxID=3347169 RepID=UPI0035DC7536